MDGQPLAADQVKAVSKWPSRKEQLSILSGQILSVGAKLSSQLLSAGSKLASQIKKKSEEDRRCRTRAAASRDHQRTNNGGSRTRPTLHP